MKKTNSILLIFIISLSLFRCNEGKKEIEEKKAVDLTIQSADYEIVKIEDQSRKALGKKLLSQYKTSELEKLPINKRILYRIVLSKDVKANQVKPTINKIINNLTANDSDIDEIILWLYSDAEISNGAFDIGSAIWAPNGELGNVHANIAETNNRDDYKINYQIKNNLEQYLKNKLETTDKFGLSLEVRKQIFKQIVKAEDDAYQYNQPKKDLVMKENKEKILKKYNITDAQLNEIGNEGLDKNWPLD